MSVRWIADQRSCPICGAESHKVLGRRGGAAHHAGLGEATTVVRCRECHLVYSRPFLMPEGNPYAEYGQAEYFQAHDMEGKREAGRRLARAAERRLGRKGRLLELGCGSGALLMGAQEEGWRVQGVEMTSGFLPPNSAMPVEISTLERARSLEERYDVILLAAILEHVYDPRHCLQRVRGALVDDGIVFIDVPNECSLYTVVGNAYMRLRGRDWAVNLSPTFPPFHVIGFCPESLRRLLDSCGLEVITLDVHRWQNELPRRSTLWSRIERAGLDMTLSVGAWVGMGAGITCWARRNAD